VLRRFGPDLTGTDGFDLVHRISPLSAVTSSPLVSHIERPMVVGPINGDLPVPAEFSELRRSAHERRAPMHWRHRVFPHARRTYRGLAGLIVGSTRASSDVPPSFRGGRLLLSEIGIEPDVFPVADGWMPPTDRFEFVAVGRLTPLKGVEMLVEAMAGSARLRQARLTIVGDGPEREAIEQAIRDYGLVGNVSMPGWLPRKDVARALARSDAFVRASVSDLRGGAVLEAMSAGLPCIVVDYGGPSDIVDESCGLRVPLAPRAGLVSGLRSAMEQLIDDDDRCRRLGRAAAEIVRARYTWDARAERIVAFYDEVREAAVPSVRAVEARAGSSV
jgi:glycosyltransferase involved in cell wall biosynthesis